MLISHFYFKIISPIPFDGTKWMGKINRMRLILFSLLLLTSISLIDLVSSQNEENIVQGLAEDGSSTPILAAELVNESIYRNLLNLTWGQYKEDLDYSSDILEDFVKKNITRREAMVATLSLYALTSETEGEFYNVKTIDKYKNIHNNTIYALSNLRGYLLNIAKFYETDKPIYAVKSRESFNSSLHYLEKAKKEYEDQNFVVKK